MVWVLVVDDDQALGRALARLLVGAGHDVQVARTQHEALDLLERQVFEFVLSDLDLGSDSGFDLLRTISRERPFVSLALMSARAVAMPPDLAHVSALEKPFSFEALVALLE